MHKGNPAQRRYILRFMPLMTAYVLILFAANRYADAHHPAGLALAMLSILPTLPLLGVILVMGLYLLEERDEFIRNRLIVSMLWGTGILLAVATVWGFLENTGMVGHPPVYLAFPLWCAAFGIVQGVLAIGDRMAGGDE